MREEVLFPLPFCFTGSLALFFPLDQKGGSFERTLGRDAKWK